MAKRSKGGLAGISTADLSRELKRRSRGLNVLNRKREKVAAKLAAIDSQIAELSRMIGVAAPVRRGARPGRRAGGGMTLPEALHKLLTGKTLSVTEAAARVGEVGYHSDAANFRVMVNAALIKHKDKFKKISRGQYTAA